MFRRKNLSKDFVELSIGKVFFKKITNKMISNIEVLSNGNAGLFFKLFEYNLINLSKRRIDKLLIDDANIVRSKLREILLRYKLIIEKEKEIVSDEVNIFKKGDVEWFGESEKNMLKNLGGKRG